MVASAGSVVSLSNEVKLVDSAVNSSVVLTPDVDVKMVESSVVV